MCVSIVCFVRLFLKELLKYSTVSPLVSLASCPGFLVKGFLEKANTDLLPFFLFCFVTVNAKVPVGNFDT